MGDVGARRGRRCVGRGCIRARGGGCMVGVRPWRTNRRAGASLRPSGLYTSAAARAEVWIRVRVGERDWWGKLGFVILGMPMAFLDL